MSDSLTVKLDSIEHLIAAIESSTNSTDLINSVKSLASQRSLEAIPSLIKALGYNNPGAAVAAMYGLVAIGREAVPQLLSLVDDYNYGARAHTIRALAKIGDPRAWQILIDCAVNDLAPSVRRAAIKGLGYLQWSWSEETIISEIQTRILATLSSILKDTDWSMRYAAVVALQQLALKGELYDCAAERIPKVVAHLKAALELETNFAQDQTVVARIKLALDNCQPKP